MSLEAGNDDFIDGGEDAAVDALLNLFEDANEPSEEDTGATADEGDETTPTDSEEESGAADDAGDDAETDGKEAADETGEDEDATAIFEFEVNGEKQEFTREQLQRLAGQEAALNRKSMEAAERRKQADGDGEKYRHALSLLERSILQRKSAYDGIDWYNAREDYGREATDAWRSELSEIEAEYQQLQAIMTDVESHTAAHRDAEEKRQWEDAQVVLRKDIPDFEKHAGDIAAYFRDHSDPSIKEVRDPHVIKAYYKAMLWDRHQAKSAEAKDVITRKKAASPTRAVAKSDVSKPAKKNDEAMSRLKKSGTTDDAMAALLAMDMFR